MSEQAEKGEWPAETIPDSWMWVHFNEFFEDRTDSRRKLPTKDYQSAGQYPVIDQGEELIGGYSDDEQIVSKANIPCIVWGDHTRCVKFINGRFIQGADGVKVLEPAAAVDARFALRAMQAVRLPNKGYSRHFKFLRSTRFPLPPLPEQLRIVAKLDSLFARTEAAREELDRISLLIKHYKQAILEKAFAGAFAGSIPTGEVPLLTYITNLDQGWSPKCEAISSDNPEDWVVIKTTSIQPLQFLKSENKVLPSNLNPRVHIQIEKDDILVTRAGPRSRVGISCLVVESRPKLMLCDKAYRLRVRKNKADPTFVVMMLNAPQALLKIEDMKTGISDSGLNLTQTKLLNLALPDFNLEQQRNTVRMVNAAMAWLDVVRTEQEKALQLLTPLAEETLATAFRGELVPQNLDDEPADKLLERTRRGQGVSTKARRGQRKAV